MKNGCKGRNSFNPLQIFLNMYFTTYTTLFALHSLLLIVDAYQSLGKIEEQCMGISNIQRLDCHPDQYAAEGKCRSRGCCWTPKNINEAGVPMCFFPNGYSAYTVISKEVTSRGLIAHLEKSQLAYDKDERKRILAEIIYETPTRLRIRFTDPSDPNRWEPPIPLSKPDDKPIKDFEYDVHIEDSPFGIKITRSNQSENILVDSTGPMASSFIFTDQFLQYTFRLYAQRGFGPGELQYKYPNTFDDWLRAGIWGHDGRPAPNINLYGTHNFFMGLSHDGSAFGIFFLNSNAQEVAITPLPAITYRTTGGILDFFILTGPKPKDVIAQYYSMIGHPQIPPYWSLGFHLCKYGTKSLDEVDKVLKRNLDAGIPVDGQWFDIDYMDAYKVWSIDQNNFGKIKDFVESKLHLENKMKAVIILDPAISTKGGKDYQPYQEGMKLGVFINDSRTGRPILGTVWPGETVFPDFSHPAAEEWWYNSAKDFYTKLPFDGLWIDMNEPASFNKGSLTGCASWSKLDNPPFVPPIIEYSLSDKTLCPSALHYNTTHYNRHNMYGYDHARVTYNTLTRMFPKTRPFILSRSSFAGSGRYTNHWTGDVVSSWESLKDSIPQIINFNMFAIPFVGADICGFGGDATEELCVRWSQVGAFYPFSRNHNDNAAREQDPAAWSPEATKAIKEALKLRYYILPYLYTLLHRAHLYGEPVVRALAFEFPEQLGAHRINEQFMLGSCILVTPVLSEGRTSVDGFVPFGEWINLSSGKREISSGEWLYFKAPINVIPILTRCGCIIPLQATAQTTELARKTGLGLAVILSSTDDGTEEKGKFITASGELFWDDGSNNNGDYVHINFEVENRILSTVFNSSYSQAIKTIDQKELDLKFIFIVGFNIIPKEILINEIPVQFEYLPDLQTCRITGNPITNLSQNLKLEWKF